MLRKLTIDDYDAIYTLWLECDGVGLIASDRRDQIAMFLRRNPGLCFVAEVEGQIVGTILGGHDGRRGYIHHQAVHPDFRRRGIGRKLAERCQAALQAEGILKAQLVVFQENKPAQAFWQSVGWYDRDDLHVMSLFLK